MRELVPAEEAQAILSRQQRAKKLAVCVNGGWDKWEELGKRVPDLMIPVGPSARALLVHNYMTDLARREFADDPGVRIGSKGGFLCLTFEDKVVIRFKKFKNGNFTTSGIPTKQQQQFAYQLSFEFEGMPPEATKLVVGYLLNELQTSIETIAVTCRVGSDLRWVLDITGEDGGGGEELEPPVRPDEPRGPRVGPKPSEQQGNERSQQ